MKKFILIMATILVLSTIVAIFLSSKEDDESEILNNDVIQSGDIEDSGEEIENDFSGEVLIPSEIISSGETNINTENSVISGEVIKVEYQNKTNEVSNVGLQNPIAENKDVKVENNVTQNTTVKAENVQVEGQTEQVVIQDVVQQNQQVTQENEVVQEQVEPSENVVSNEIVSIPVGKVGIIKIDKIGLYQVVADGHSLDVLKTDLGHVDSTAYADGNVGILGHNSGNAGYFKRLTELKLDDEIEYFTTRGVKKYKVSEIVQIDDTDWSKLANTEDNRITLITCVKNVPSKRLCVQATEVK